MRRVAGRRPGAARQFRPDGRSPYSVSAVSCAKIASRPTDSMKSQRQIETDGAGDVRRAGLETLRAAC